MIAFPSTESDAIAFPGTESDATAGAGGVGRGREAGVQGGVHRTQPRQARARRRPPGVQGLRTLGVHGLKALEVCKA